MKYMVVVLVLGRCNFVFVSFIGCCIAFVYLNQQNVACFCFFYLYWTLVPHFQLRVWFVNKFICGWGFSCSTLFDRLRPTVYGFCIW